jgi:hypothetical protein
MGYLFHKAFENAGVKVAEKPSDVAELLAKALELYAALCIWSPKVVRQKVYLTVNHLNLSTKIEVAKCRY